VENQVERQPFEAMAGEENVSDVLSEYSARVAICSRLNSVLR